MKTYYVLNSPIQFLKKRIFEKIRARFLERNFYKDKCYSGNIQSSIQFQLSLVQNSVNQDFAFQNSYVYKNLYVKVITFARIKFGEFCEWVVLQKQVYAKKELNLQKPCKMQNMSKIRLAKISSPKNLSLLKYKLIQDREK